VTRFFLALAGCSILVAGCGPASTDSVAPTAEAVPVAEQPPADADAVSNGAVPAAAPARARTLTSAATPATAPAPPAATYREVVIPAGTPLSLRLASAVASDSSQVEDTVRATLSDAVTVDGSTALPAGTELTGTVTDVERSGRVKGLARVAFRFGTVRHDGELLEIRTEAIQRVAEATKGEDAKKIGIGTGVGAAIGAVLGGGDGAAKGAAIGAAAGTGTVLATRGEEVRLGPGDAVRTRLAAPLTVRVSAAG
jgi:hypothetical protein